MGEILKRAGITGRRRGRQYAGAVQFRPTPRQVEALTQLSKDHERPFSELLREALDYGLPILKRVCEKKRL